MGIFGNANINIKSPQINPEIFQKVGLSLLVLFIIVIIGVIITIIIIRKNNKKKYIYNILFTKEVNGQIYIVGEDIAKELIIPYTSIKVFFLKKRGTWSPKLIYESGKNTFIIHIGKGGEWINTNLRYGKDGIIELNDELKPSRDYANENLKELIERNWTNKNKNWLKENSIFIFLIILGIIIIITLIIGLRGAKKMSSAFAYSSENYLKASEVYSKANEDLIKVVEKKFSDSGVFQDTTT